MRRFLFLSVLILTIGFAAPGWAADKLGVVDVQMLMGQSKAGKSIETQVNKQRETFKAEFEKLEKELMDLQKGLEKVDQASEDFAKKRGDLEKRMMEANRLVQQRRQSLDRAAAQAVMQLETEIVKAVGEIAKVDGYTLVVRSQAVVVAGTELDITDRVLKELDKKVSDIKLSMDGENKAAPNTKKKN